MSKSTFKILFYIRKNQVNKEGKSGIMIRLTDNGEIVQFSSKLDVVPEQWDVNTQRMAGNSLKARQLTITTSRYMRRMLRRKRFAMLFWE